MLVDTVWANGLWADVWKQVWAAAGVTPVYKSQIKAYSMASKLEASSRANKIDAFSTTGKIER